jgi:hypothetical protein
MTRPWTAWLSVGLIATVALVGCSDKQEASESLPLASSSAAPTEEEFPPLGPEDMPMPDEARTQDATGAEAFALYYIELINRTAIIMDPQPLLDLSDGCRDCDRIARNVEKDAAEGLQYRGGQVTITETGPPLVKPGTAELAWIGHQAAASGVDSTGADVAKLALPAFPSLSGGASMRWDDDRATWLMTGLTLE